MRPHALRRERATLRIHAKLYIQPLALVVEASGRELWHVSSSTSSEGPFVQGVMTCVGGAAWDLLEHGADEATRVSWTSPDDAFALAVGQPAPDPRGLAEAAPHWPDSVMGPLARRGLSGPGTVAFDAGWFLDELATSALEHPIVLPAASSKLGLAGLQSATTVLRTLAAAAGAVGSSSHSGLAELLLRAVREERPSEPGLAWGGDGRLIGEYPGGELGQLGDRVDDGCRAALGTGPLEVVFASDEPLGLGLGPLLYAEDAEAFGGRTDDGSVGVGCVAGEVEPGGAAERAGVRPGMPLAHLSGPHLPLPGLGPDALSFEEVLDAIDTRRALGHPLTITFDTAAPVTHLYAVEMPAATALRAVAARGGEAALVRSRDVGVGASFDALCGRALIWREQTPRLFLGEPGSVTCAHTDMCPQVQMAHGLVGTKLVGVASHSATSRLAAEHAPDDEGEDGEFLEGEATTVPTDRPLTARAARMLCDPEVSVAVLRAGDLAVFDSGALHFVSNGAEALSGAVYHGLITPGAVPRLRRAAAAHHGSQGSAGDGYSDHLFAPELLRLVEQRLASIAG